MSILSPQEMINKELNEKIEELRKDVNFNNDSTSNRITNIHNHYHRVTVDLLNTCDTMSKQIDVLLDRIGKLEREKMK